MYNRYRFNPDFKKEAERVILTADIIKRVELRKHKRNFTLIRLLACRHQFEKYIYLHGESAPIQTSFAWFNAAANYTLSLTHYIATNQKYAAKVLQYMEEARLNTDKKETVTVFNTLKAIKEIHNTMESKRIYGRTRKSIEQLLKKFNLPLDKQKFAEHMEKIADVLKYIDELDDHVRILTPAFIA